MKRCYLRLSVAMAACLLVESGPNGQALAQEDSSSAAQNSAQRNNADIIVTARKRAENIQDVSESITAISGASIETLQITQPTDLTRVAPALTFRDNPIPTSSGFVIRGIGTSTFSSTVEQSVSTVFDGVVLGQPQSAAAFVDIQRVEVLEGPQGLLFGKNASAGLVNIVTNSPRLGELGADMSFTIGTDGELRNSGMLNIPVGETLAVRLVGFRNRTDGYVNNLYRNERYNGEKNYGLRGKLLYSPTENISLLVSADYAKDTASGAIATSRKLGENTNLASYFEEYKIKPGPNNRDTVLGSPYGTYDGAPLRVYKGISGQLDIDFGELSLTSITGYRKNHYILDFDADQSPLPRFDYNGGEYNYKQFSQELRLASPAGKTIEWLAGLYYFRSINNVNFWSGGYLLAPTTLTVAVIDTDFRSRSYAAFGSITWNLSDATRLRAGGRYTRDKIYARRNAYDLEGAMDGSSAIIGSVAGDTTERGGANNFSWKLTAEQDFGANNMLYASVARGYKGPGLASSGVITPGIDPLIRPEKVWAFDLGVKTSFWDNRATFNAALFYEDFSDFQTQVYDTSTTPPSFRTTNAGGLKTKGVQGQLTIRPTDGLSFGANVAYVDASYRDLDGISCPYAWSVSLSNGCRLVGGRPVIDVSGNRMANSPEFKFNLNANYEASISSSADFLLSADYSWRSDEQFSSNGDPLTIQPAYGIFNGSVGLGLDNGKWEVRAFVRNLFDKKYVNLITANAADTSGGYSQYFSRYTDRQFGVTMRMRLRD